MAVDTLGGGTWRIQSWPELRSLAERGGPVASVYLTSARDVENAAQVSLQRWRSLADALAEQGADSATLERVEVLVGSAHEHGGCLAVFGSGGSLWHVGHGPDSPAADFAIWDSVPALGPLIRWRQEARPHLLVVTDRRGADITTVDHQGEPDELTIDLEDGRPLRKVAPGGWSQRRYQQRAENTWETHARQIAEQVQRAADEIGAEVIVVAGDVRAVELLEKHLPERLRARVQKTAGGRSADGSLQRVEEAAHRWVRTVAARSTVELLEKFREEVGQHDRAAAGVAATFRALNLGQVEVLLVHDDWGDDRRACFGPEPTPIARNPDALVDSGITEPIEGRLVDVAIRAALGTGAGVWIVPSAGGPAEGIGALLRWRRSRTSA